MRDGFRPQRNYFRGQSSRRDVFQLFEHTGCWSIVKCSRFSMKFSKWFDHHGKHKNEMVKNSFNKKKKPERHWRSVKKNRWIGYRLGMQGCLCESYKRVTWEVLDRGRHDAPTRKPCVFLFIVTCNSVFVTLRVSVHRRTNSSSNLCVCTIRESKHHGARFRGVHTLVFVPPARMCTMQVDWPWTLLLCRAESRQSSCTCWGDHPCLLSFFASHRHTPQWWMVQSDDITAFDTKAWLNGLQ